MVEAHKSQGAHTAVVHSDSAVYRASFFGILNQTGGLWSPLAFESEADAKARLDRFWGVGKWSPRDFKIVPVRIRLETIANATGAA